MDDVGTDISRLIPHRGAMCLLEAIESWDQEHIVCRATSHRRPDNPLRDDSGLRALCGIEYGAQAIATHAALLGRPGGRGAQPGVLAAVRDVTTTLSHLDALHGALTIRATVVLRHAQGRIYDVTVEGDGRTLLTGRLSVITPTNGVHQAESVPAERVV
ncbi:MAG: putative 3-hydroxydecyl-(Acyl carrier protein) dehydratase [Nitrospira sp.]|jgi:predicted hotdog family 3-hydroxylacyl-ACP dehydratase|nr:putative 3-hydroxydecyl-(Acyl carrier protein) dehydratase [Nitrospira sp.]